MGCRHLNGTHSLYEITGALLNVIPPCSVCGAVNVQEVNINDFIRYLRDCIRKNPDGSGYLFLDDKAMKRLEICYRKVIHDGH